MAWQFGSPTNNRVQVSQIGTGATLRTGLVAGWWRPTTLTAGKTYWSQGSIVSARIAATTSEMTLHTDNVTDGQWTTSGAGIVAGEWQFLAFMLSTLNGTPSAAWRVWRGTNDTAPVEVTVVIPPTTAPAGNFTGTGTFTMGQLGSGTVALEGIIGSMVSIAKEGTANAGSSLRGPLKTAAYGAITQDEANVVLERIVWPLWCGNKFPDDVWDTSIDGLATQYLVSFMPTDQAQPTPAGGTATRMLCQLSSDPRVGMTIAGAPIYSDEREPRGWNAVQTITRGFRRR